MESVDNTPRRHIGYHKPSKNQRLCHDRSSSCPMYSSPPNIKPKKSKTKVDILATITNTINHLNNSFLLNKDKDKSSSQNKRDHLIKENAHLINQNEKLKALISSYNNNNNTNYDSHARHFQDNSYQDYNRKVIGPLLKENQTLLQKLNECKLNWKQDREGESKFRPQVMSAFLNKQNHNILNQLKNQLEMFNTYFLKCDNCYKDDWDESNNYMYNDYNYDHYTSNKDKNRSKKKSHLNNDNYHYSDDNYYSNGYGINHYEHAHFDKHYFDNNTNITDLTEEEDHNDNNIVLTTEKCDKSYCTQKENVNKIEIYLNEYEINNNDRKITHKTKNTENNRKASDHNYNHNRHNHRINQNKNYNHQINNSIKKRPKYFFKDNNQIKYPNY